MSDDGGQVKISGETQNASGCGGSQILTITPTSGQTVIQGMATISGGDLGSMITTSTSTSSATYVIRVQYPGIQGAPGKLTFRLQFGPPVGPAPGRRAIS
jgi:hypothetical protein